MVEIAEQRIHVGPVELNVATGPDNGPPVVFLHGAGSTWQDWSAILDRMAPDWRVIAVDLRGYGGSGWTTGQYETVDITPDIERLIAEFVGGPVHVVGHSLGGAVALDLLARWPERVHRAILEEPGLFIYEWFDSWALAPLLRLAIDTIAAGGGQTELEEEIVKVIRDPVQSAKFAEALTSCDPDVLRAIAETTMATGFHPDELLGRVTTPTLLLYGDPKLGGVTRDEDVPRIQAAASSAIEVRHIPDVGHGIHLAMPDQFTAIVQGFFDTSR